MRYSQLARAMSTAFTHLDGYSRYRSGSHEDFLNSAASSVMLKRFIVSAFRTESTIESFTSTKPLLESYSDEEWQAEIVRGQKPMVHPGATVSPTEAMMSLSPMQSGVRPSRQ